MKITSDTIEDFKPINLNIKIESIDELLTLWAVFAELTESYVEGIYEKYEKMRPEDSRCETYQKIFDEINMHCKKNNRNYLR